MFLLPIVIHSIYLHYHYRQEEEEENGKPYPHVGANVGND
jgi:hypothetical protein